MVPPSNEGVDYNFRRKGPIKLNGQANQPILIDEKIFKNRIRNGFFIEAGAYDGEVISNTLFFELKQSWTGLLIEPNPDAFEELNKKVCLHLELGRPKIFLISFHFIAASKSLAIWALSFHKINT